MQDQDNQGYLDTFQRQYNLNRIKYFENNENDSRLYVTKGIRQEIQTERDMLHIHIEQSRNFETNLFEYTRGENPFKVVTAEIKLKHYYIFFRMIKQKQTVKIECRSNYNPKLKEGFIFMGAQLFERQGKWVIKFIPLSKLVKQLQIQQQGVQRPNGWELQKILDPFLIVKSFKDVKTLRQKGFRIQQDQFFKFGRALYQVISVSNQNNRRQITQKMLSPNEVIFDYDQKIKNQIKKEDICRICMEEENNQNEDWLIQPCECKGSAQYVHFSCLQTWMEQRVKRQNQNGVIQYNFGKFKCQVCLFQLPRYIKLKGKVLELMAVGKPKGDHVMLKGITSQANSLVVLEHFDTNEIKIGRNQQCEFYMDEMTVSRLHSKIQKIGNQLYIFDTNSKFGTLVNTQDMEIQLDYIKRAIQISNITIAFEIRKIKYTELQIQQIIRERRIRQTIEDKQRKTAKNNKLRRQQQLKKRQRYLKEADKKNSMPNKNQQKQERIN